MLRCLLILPIVALAVGCVRSSLADESAIAGVNNAMQKFVDAGQMSGVVTLVSHRGKTIHLQAAGLADVEAGRPMKTDSIFAIASMTKPITATGLMILVDEGKVNIDDPISKYIPQFKAAKLKDGKLNRELIIRDVLTHTSGLGGSQQTQGTLEETAIALANRNLSFQPGTKWQYSPGLNVCARIIDVASGEAYDSFLQKRVFAPLQMKDTTFHPTSEQQARIAKLYKPGKEAGSLAFAEHWLTDFSPDRTPNPSGGLFSTASDMAKFYNMVLSGGEANGKRIVSEASVKQMTKIQTGDIVTGFTPGNGWGLGWCVVREPQGVTDSVSPGTYGHGGAFGTQGWVDPKTKTVYVLMVQRTQFGNSDGSEIRKQFHDQTAKTLN